MLAALDRTLGRLLLATLVVVTLLAVATSLAPNVLGFDWLGPLRILRSVLTRSGFLTAIGVGWILGRLASVPRVSPRDRLSAVRERLRRVRHDAWFWHGATLGVACACLARIAVPSYHLLDLIMLALLVGARCTKPSSPAERRAFIVEASRVALLFVGSSYVFTVIKAFLFVLRTPQDAGIIAFETSLFGRPIHHHVVAWVASNSRLADVFDEAYFMLFEHMTVASAFLGAAQLPRERTKLWSSLALCYLIGGPAYYLLPGLGPAFIEPELYRPIADRGLLSRDFWEVLSANTNAMRERRPIELTAYSFIACMPSLHIAHEVVMLWYARFSRPFFVLSLLFTATSTLAVMALGWHYFVDIFGGLALAVLVIIFVERVGPGLPTTTAAPQEEAAVENRKPRWVPLAIVLGTIAIYWPVWTNPLVLEDFGRVRRPLSFVTLRGLASVLTNVGTSAAWPLETARFYRPGQEAVDWVTLIVLDAEPRAHHLASLALLGFVAYLFHRILERLGVHTVLRWLATIVIVLHPVAGLTAGYLSARVWLVGAGVFWLAATRLARERRALHAIAVTFVGSALLGLLHEGMVFAGLALPLIVPRDDGAPRPASAIAAAVGCLVVSISRAAILAPSDASIRDFLGAVLPSAAHLARSLFAEGTPSPALTLPSASGTAMVIAGSVVLAGLGAAWLWALRRLTTESARFLGAAAAIVPSAILAGAVASASRHGVSSAASWPVLVGIVLVGATLLNGALPRLADRVSPALRRRAALLPVVTAVAATTLAWANLSPMSDPERFAAALFEVHPDDERVALLAGSVFAASEKPAEARTLCERASTKRVHVDDSTCCLLMASAVAPEPVRTSDLAERLLPRFEASSEVRNIHVLALARSGQLERAANEAERLLVRYPDDQLLRRLDLALRQREMPATIPPERPASKADRGHFSASPTR